MSSQVVENEEAPSGNSKSKSASTVNLHALTKTIVTTSSSNCDSAHGNQTRTEPSDSYPRQNIPQSPLPPYNLQPEQCGLGQDNEMTMDVDNNLDYNTNTDLSAIMVVDDSESKSIHPFFKKLYLTPLLSSPTDRSEKAGQKAGLKRRREEEDDFDEKDNAQN